MALAALEWGWAADLVAPSKKLWSTTTTTIPADGERLADLKTVASATFATLQTRVVHSSPTPATKPRTTIRATLIGTMKATSTIPTTITAPVLTMAVLMTA